RFGEKLSAFEIFPEPALAMVLRHIPGTRNPFAAPPAWVTLAELWDTLDNPALTSLFEEALAEASQKEILKDAAIARSETQRRDLWKLRDSIAEAQKKDGDGIKHDVSVPVAAIPEFIAKADAAVETIVPGFTRVAFGHMGDGNIHYDPCPPRGMNHATFLKKGGKISRAVNGIVASLGGSISAEHGIGAARRRELAHYKDKESLALYRAVKKALDPKGVMNPGKLI
ncbi:MAG TPA: FAD-linked oxidase C-terminal domain-containing protein, partial [Sphingomonadales bacterium]|nr:FAD-linked oxidase C-terminal domain-containing protein [Sphingomonadales bacterium]